MRSLALVGPMGVGKSTIARHFEILGATRISWTDPLRQVFAMAYDDITPENYNEVKYRTYSVSDENGDMVERSGRELLQRIGTEAIRNHVDQEFWVRAGTKRILRNPETVWVNDDTRFPNEALALRACGFLIVRLMAPETVRAARLKMSSASLAEFSRHASERGQNLIHADLNLDATETPERLVEEIRHHMRVAA